VDAGVCLEGLELLQVGTAGGVTQYEGLQYGGIRLQEYCGVVDCFCYYGGQCRFAWPLWVVLFCTRGQYCYGYCDDQGVFHCSAVVC